MLRKVCKDQIQLAPVAKGGCSGVRVQTLNVGVAVGIGWLCVASGMISDRKLRSACRPPSDRASRGRPAEDRGEAHAEGDDRYRSEGVCRQHGTGDFGVMASCHTAIAPAPNRSAPTPHAAEGPARPSSLVTCPHYRGWNHTESRSTLTKWRRALRDVCLSEGGRHRPARTLADWLARFQAAAGPAGEDVLQQRRGSTGNPARLPASWQVRRQFPGQEQGGPGHWRVSRRSYDSMKDH
jgi:hypothetical protein